MAEKNSELDAINHLLEIEKDAAVLINDAKVEADRRICDAKNRYNKKYKEEFEKISSKLDSDYQKKVSKIADKYTKEIDAYKADFEAKEQNEAAFSALLDKLLLQ